MMLCMAPGDCDDVLNISHCKTSRFAAAAEMLRGRVVAVLSRRAITSVCRRV